MGDSIDKELTKKIAELQEWHKTNPNLPKKIDQQLFQRFLCSVRGDVEAAKRLMETNYKMRNKHADIYLNRDPCAESSQKLLSVADLLELPGKAKDNSKLILYRLRDFNPENFNFNDAVRVYFMVADCRFAVEDNVEADEVSIFDMTGYTLKYLTRTVLSTLRVYMKFIQEAHPIRIKHIHVINAPSYVDKVMAVAKPFIKKEVYNLIHFHSPNAETPYEYFSRDILPEEYGGKAGKLDDLRSYWHEKLKENREYIMDESRWKVSSANSEVAQTFTHLNID